MESEPVASNQATGAPAGGAGQRRVRAYSRAVAWMKVLLPLAALAVVAGLFFSAQKSGDLTEIFTIEELAALGAGLRLDNPRFAGVTEQGEPFAIRAAWALPDRAIPRVVDLERPEGEIELSNGRTVAARADTGRMNRQQKTLVLKGAVVLDTSDGYRIETGRIDLDLGAKSAAGPGPISGSGPGGELDAGSFRAEAGEDGAGNGRIWFENRVRVLLIPGAGSGGVRN